MFKFFLLTGLVRGHLVCAVEFGVWSHSGLNGPTGSAATSSDPLDSKQMTTAGWGKTDFNWSNGNNRAGFYGCRSGMVTADKPVSFATEISSLANFGGVLVFGQSNFSFPSPFTNERSPTFDQTFGDYLPLNKPMLSGLGANARTGADDFKLRKTYMVAGGKENMATERSVMWGVGGQKLNFSKNGTATGSAYQAGDKK